MNRRVASFDFALPKAMPMPALYVRYSVAARRFVACTFAAFSRLSLSPPSVCKPLAVLWQLPARLPGPCLLPGACPPASPARLLVSVCWSAHWMVGNSVTWLPTRYSDRMFEKHTAAALRCTALARPPEIGSPPHHTFMCSPPTPLPLPPPPPPPPPSESSSLPPPRAPSVSHLIGSTWEY